MLAKNFYFNALKSAIPKKTREEIGEIVAEVLRVQMPQLEIPSVMRLDFNAIACSSILRELSHCGLFTFKSLLTDSEVKAMLNSILDSDAYFQDDFGNRFKKLEATKEQKNSSRYQFFDVRPLLEMDFLKDKFFFNQPLIAMVSSYLGAPAVVSSVTFWKSIPNNLGSKGAHLFHQDRGDFRSVNLFVYLTDVNDLSGPHEYFKYTHRYAYIESYLERLTALEANLLKQHIDQHRYDSDLLSQYFGDPIRILGNSGDGFLEDTNGIHRGVTPIERSRICFEIIFTLVKQANTDSYDVISQNFGELSPLIRYANQYIYR